MGLSESYMKGNCFPPLGSGVIEFPFGYCYSLLMKNISKCIYSVVFFIYLVGCSSNSTQRIAVLQNPETKQTVECRVNPWGSFDRDGQITSCVNTYVKAGYVKLSDSAE